MSEAILEAEAKRRGISVTTLKMLEAVPDEVIRAIVSDGRKGISRSTSMIAPEHQRAERSEPVRRGTGLSEPKPLQPPPGIALIDAMCEVADAKERAERRGR
jgi:hypothetical protein